MATFRKLPVMIDAYRLKKRIEIPALEGVMVGNPGDWLITGVDGEQYPCKDDIFRKTYEPVGTIATEMWNSDFNGTAQVCYPLDGDVPIYQAFGHGGPRNPHVGVDFAVRVGTPVRAIMDGDVYETAEDSRTYGRYISILHQDGYLSLYAHLSRLIAKRGGSVRAGEVIGLTGGAVGGDGSGKTTGPHLHFEVRPPGNENNNRNNVDPMEYIELRL